MRTILSLLPIILNFASTVEAKDLAFRPSVTSNQELTYSEGRSTLVDRGQKTSAGVQDMNHPILDRSSFLFLAQNENSRTSSYNFGPGNITATINGRPVSILPLDELLRIIRSRYTSADILRGLGDMGDKLNGDTFGRMRNESDRQSRQSEAVQQIEALNQMYLKTETIRPGENTKGLVVIYKIQDAKPGDEIIFDVETGGDHHMFRFAIR